MTDICVANRTTIAELIGWLTEHGVDYAVGYAIRMTGTEQVSGHIHFYPLFTFVPDVDPAVLTEFSLRFS